MFMPGSEIVVLESSVQKAGPRRGSLGFVCSAGTNFNPEPKFIDNLGILKSGFVSRMVIAFSRFGYEHNRRIEKKQVTVISPLDYHDFPNVNKKIEALKSSRGLKAIYMSIAPVTSPHTVTREGCVCYVSSVFSACSMGDLKQFYKLQQPMPEYEYLLSRGSIWYTYAIGLYMNNTMINRMLLRNNRTLQGLMRVAKMIEVGINTRRAQDITELARHGHVYFSDFLKHSIKLRTISSSLYHPILLPIIAKYSGNEPEFTNIITKLFENTRSMAKAALSSATI